MAELEFAGVKFKGGKIFVILTALTTLGGGLWAGFEFYKDYLNMKEKVETYVSPDLSDYDKRIDLSIQKIDMLESEMKIILDEVTLVSDVAKDMKNDLKTDVRRIENIVEDVEQRVKEDSRENAKDLKFAIKEVKEKMQDLENRVDDKIQKALENPLANMRKN
tara:strand:- start:802 stop:1290 length:489 start_codon:yes stop_codon:yes gene_type:complete